MTQLTLAATLAHQTGTIVNAAPYAAEFGTTTEGSDSEEMIVRHSTRSTRPALPAPPIWQKVYDGIYAYLLSVTDNKYPYIPLTNWTAGGRGRGLDPVLRPERADETHGIIELPGCQLMAERCVKEGSIYYDMGCGALNTAVFMSATCRVTCFGAEVNTTYYEVAKKWQKTD